MSCCTPRTEAGAFLQETEARAAEEVRLASRMIGESALQTDLSVPSAHCRGCIAAIEGALSRLDGVVSARLNLSSRRVSVQWRKDSPVPPLLRALSDAGYEASVFSPSDAESDPEMGRLVRALAVAGFAAMNIMLLSVSIWSGADDATRNVFHLLSALLALPAVAYSGRIFFRSAWSALSAGRTNMDVPISVGILLASSLSMHDTVRGGPHAYFDAVTTLIFFLLVGRTLDHMMRQRARTAVLGLAKMMPRGAMVVSTDETTIYKLQEEIEPGEVVLVRAGDRVPCDGVVEAGAADVDAALVTGEASPVALRAGSSALAGMLNLNGSVRVRVARAAANSFISEMMGLMEAAEHGRARYRRIADRAAAFYSPVVHGFAAASFLGWMAATGDWHRALTVAISVLIITCPCALGLAVPMVQVVAARRLFERGIALKDGSALERLAEADTVIFDKTGTLTMGELSVTKFTVSGRDLDAAAALAQRSLHPASRAIAALGGRARPLEIEEFAEHPGEGLAARIGGRLYRLGRPDWALSGREPSEETSRGTALSRDGLSAGSFEFADIPRPQTREAVNALHELGLTTEMLSGDRRETAAALAASVGISRFDAGLLPRDKVERLEQHRRQGRRTLMVGDGLNDAPALCAAHVSMAPASAADIGRAAADLVFFGKTLIAVPEAIGVARTARRLAAQNLMLAGVYNLIVIPVALTGHVTPIMAAIAMSLSSVLVVGNALRFPGARRHLTVVSRPKTAMVQAPGAAL